MLIFSFFLALIALFLRGVCFPSIPFNPFIPWIAIVVLSYQFQKDLWKPFILCMTAGVLLDLFCNHPIGVYACSYSLVAAPLLCYRNRFLYDSPIHLSLCTSFISFAASLLQVFFLFLFDRKVAIPGTWILANGLGVSLIDGAYSLIWFSGPLYLFFKMRRGWILFRLKRKRA